MGRLRALIVHLPPESAYRRATDQWWTDAHELAAVQVELTHALLVGLARLGGSKRKVVPLRVPRPGEPVHTPHRRKVSWLTLMGVEPDASEAG